MNPDPASLAHLRHELRTPLNHILGYSEMLLEDAGDAELAGELQRIRGEGQALLAVVENALARARPRAPRLGPVRAARWARGDRGPARASRERGRRRDRRGGQPRRELDGLRVEVVAARFHGLIRSRTSGAPSTR
jgi:signal transduction histidine kinase